LGAVEGQAIGDRLGVCDAVGVAEGPGNGRRGERVIHYAEVLIMRSSEGNPMKTL
jgi:hypothetical protein